LFFHCTILDPFLATAVKCNGILGLGYEQEDLGARVVTLGGESAKSKRVKHAP
jgi:hypothetical protein